MTEIWWHDKRKSSSSLDSLLDRIFLEDRPTNPSNLFAVRNAVTCTEAAAVREPVHSIRRNDG